jgi:hypothetical protein
VGRAVQEQNSRRTERAEQDVKRKEKRRCDFVGGGIGKKERSCSVQKKDGKEIAAVLQIFVVKAGNLFPNKKKPNDLCV